MTRLLLLSGTAEARQIAGALAGDPKVRVTASLAGSTRHAVEMGVPTRIGGFGGRAPFAAYLRAERIGAVLDATHPFADRISHRTAAVCAELSVPYLQLLRPPWVPGPDDNWVFLPSEAHAADHIAAGAIVFLATGPQRLDQFAGLTGRRIYCRRIDRPRSAFPFEGGEYLVGRPPFSVDDEVRLFRELGVDWLVVRNSGGGAGRSKLDAARVLGLRVAMIDRPAPPDAQRVSTVSAALDWVRGLA